jgi:nucleoside phosphorylase
LSRLNEAKTRKELLDPALQDEVSAKEALLEGIQSDHARPITHPNFSGHSNRPLSLGSGGLPGRAASDPLSNPENRPYALHSANQSILDSPRERPTDFVIITALQVELEALLEKLPSNQRLSPADEDVRVYYQADLPTTFSDGTTGSYRLVLLSLLGMGRVQAANATSDAIRRWHPRYVLLVGIAGGIAEADAKQGDVIISDQIADYEHQKLTHGGEQIRWEVHRADPRLLEAARHLGENWRRLIKKRRPIRGRPKCLIGPVATGEKVVAIKDVLEHYRSDWPKLIGIEMEAGGVASAAFQSAQRPGFLMIRGVSDLADENKDDTWRQYAYHAAAAYTVALLQSGPVSFSKQEESSQHKEQADRVTTQEQLTETSIFLSYARDDDEPFVKCLYEDLTSRGFNVWWDRIAMPNRGLTFLSEIRDAIAVAHRFILVVGPNALESDYVRAEWEYALSICKPVLPLLRIGDYERLPDELSAFDVPDFRHDAQYQTKLAYLVRQIGEPVAPLGKLVGVPTLPPHYLARPIDLRAIKASLLADVQKPIVVTSLVRRVGIHGMSGIGKTALATATAFDCEIRRAFPDGIIWLTLGQSPNLTARQSDLCRVMGDSIQIFADTTQGRARLSELLADRACLIILDDLCELEQATAFDIPSPRCSLLITTRDARVITALGAIEHQLNTLSEAEALSLMANWQLPLEDTADYDEYYHILETQIALPSEARDIAKECGYLPMALALSAAQVRDGTSWADLLAALRSAQLDFLDHPYGSILKSLKVNLDTLQRDRPIYAECYIKLAVFFEGIAIPEEAILTLWQHIHQLKPHDARHLLVYLNRTARIRVEVLNSQRYIVLHSLQFDYLRNITSDIPQLHAELLEAYRSKCSNGWPTGPNDGYFYDYLVYHLINAGQPVNPLFENDAWMRARFQHSGYLYSGFSADISAAWNAMEGQEIYDHDQLQTNLVLYARYGLLSSSISTLAKNVPHRLIVRSVDLGYWPLARAVALVSRLPAASERVTVYAGLLSIGSLTFQERQELQRTALEVVFTISDKPQHLQALLILLPELQGIFRDQGLGIILEQDWGIILAREENYKTPYANGLYDLCDRLDEEERNKILNIAIEVALNTKDSYWLKERLTRIASYLINQHPQQDLLLSVLDSALTLSESYCADVLCAFVPYLRDHAMERALQIAFTMASEQLYFKVCFELMSYLPDDLFTRVLETALAFEDTLRRACALSILATQPKTKWRSQAQLEAINAVLMIAREPSQLYTDEQQMAYLDALGLIAPELHGESMSEVFSMLTQHNSEIFRGRGLGKLAPCLTGDLLKQGFELALQPKTSRFLSDEVHSLGLLVPHLQGELLHHAIEVALETSDNKIREAILVGVAPLLPNDMLERIMNVVMLQQDSQSDRRYNSFLSKRETSEANVLVALAPRLHGSLLEKALTRAMSYRSPLCRVRGLEALLPQIKLERDIVTLEHVLSEAKGDFVASQMEKEFSSGDFYPFEMHPIKPEQLRGANLKKALEIALKLPQVEGRRYSMTPSHNNSPRANALILLVPYLKGTLLRRALEGVLNIDVEWARHWALNEFAPYLQGEQIAIALEASLALHDEPSRENVLGLLVPLLEGQKRTEVFQWELKAALTAQRGRDRVEAVVNLLSRSEAWPSEDILENALRAMEEVVDSKEMEDALVALTLKAEGKIPNKLLNAILSLPVIDEGGGRSPRAQAIVKLIPVFQDDVLPLVLDAVLEIPQELPAYPPWMGWHFSVYNPRTGLLCELAPRLKGDLAQKAFTEGIKIWLFDYPQYAEICAAYASQLEQNTLKEILKEALSFEENGAKAWLIAHILPYLQDKELRTSTAEIAYDAALSFVAQDQPERMDLVYDLLPFLGNRTRDKALSKAAQLILSTANLKERAQGITYLAKYFSHQQLDEILAATLEEIQSLSSEIERAEALTAIASQLEGKTLSHALQIVLAFEGEDANNGSDLDDIRTLMLSTPAELIPRFLDEPTKYAELGRAVQVLRRQREQRGIFQSYRARVLDVLAPRLQKTMLPAILDILPSFPENQQTEVLCVLSPYLEEEDLLTRALEALLSLVECNDARNPSLYIYTLKVILLHLSENMLEKVLEVALACKDELTRANILVESVSYMKGDLLSSTYLAVLSIKEEIIRTWALIRIAQYLPDKDHERALQEAFSGALALDGRNRAMMLLMLLSVAGDKEHEHIKTALIEALTQIGNEKERLETLLLVIASGYTGQPILTKKILELVVWSFKDLEYYTTALVALAKNYRDQNWQLSGFDLLFPFMAAAIRDFSYLERRQFLDYMGASSLVWLSLIDSDRAERMAQNIIEVCWKWSWQ